MPLVLTDFAASDVDYVTKMNNNNAAIKAAVNALQAAVLATAGAGADLILDLWDRDGLVGSSSYVLDVDAYGGASTIKIGRRPTNIAPFELDVSTAWGTFAGVKDRVQQAGDVTLDAATLVVPLPTTIFVGIPAAGVAQLYPDEATPNVLYAYSMAWDGFSLSGFTRLCAVLPAYSMMQDLAGEPRFRELFDPDTDWMGDLVSATSIVFPGDLDDNGVIAGTVEIIGFYVTCQNATDDGFFSPDIPPNSNVTLKITDDETNKWNLEDIVIDASDVPDTVFVHVDVVNIGNLRFVDEIKEFKLELVSLGSAVVSARSFSWGVVYRPLFGAQIPKNLSPYDLI